MRAMRVILPPPRRHRTSLTESLGAAGILVAASAAV
jgi:hypothetical protein